MEPLVRYDIADLARHWSSLGVAWCGVGLRRGFHGKCGVACLLTAAIALNLTMSCMHVSFTAIFLDEYCWRSRHLDSHEFAGLPRR